MRTISIIMMGTSLLVSQTGFAHGQFPVSLQRVPIPPVEGKLGDNPVNVLPEDGPDPIVINKEKAIALGKALFWDINVGSDGMACGSCHFRAGVDGRVKNQLNPGAKSSNASGQTFQPTFTGLGGPNYTLKLGDFPTHRFNNMFNNQSGVTYTTDDVVSSAGTFSGEFQAASKFAGANDQCDRSSPDSQFHVGSLNTRRVEPRNAPTVINAVFNHRLFWDGRANNIFNGSSPWGDRDPNAGVWVKVNPRNVAKQKLHLINSALASLSVAPPLSDTEMGCRQRNLADVGRKLLLRQPLQNQKVHNQDSVLGPYSLSTPGNLKPGLNTVYKNLIRDAFNQKFWSYTGNSQFGGPSGQMPYNQMEANFSMFFGLALQLYQATLVSDQSPFDVSHRDSSGIPVDLSANAITGFKLFSGNHCNLCHIGPTNTLAAVATNANLLEPKIDPNTNQPMTFGPSHSPTPFGEESMGEPYSVAMSRYVNVVGRDGTQSGLALMDYGYVNTGVGDPNADPGVGGVDDFGNPLSFAKQYIQYLVNNNAAIKDEAVKQVRSCQFYRPLAYKDDEDYGVLFTNPHGIEPDGSREEASQPGTILERSQNCPVPQGIGIPVVGDNAYIPTIAAAQAALNDPNDPKLKDATKGAFKIPTLRNIELTGPYMHNGSLATLDQVLDFYSRLGNFPNDNIHANLPTVAGLGENIANRTSLLAFLKSLTDDRVRYEKAPFDHPEIAVPHGHSGDHVAVNSGNTLGPLQAKDELLVVPAVGANGAANPLLPFDTLLAQ
jgi:cytochrome c peroxidase